MTYRPLVSVIMNCHNGERYLFEAINSVINQTYMNWEIIFFDNQSVDGSKRIVENLQDNRIKYYRSSEYLCLGEARNQAINKSKGELIAFLDTDDLWLPSKLEKQIPLFDDQKIGIVICDTIFFKNGIDIRRLYKKNKPKFGYVYRELLANYFISLETAIIRKLALDRMDQWFDSRFEVIEEYDFFIRLSKKWDLGFVDEVLAKWRIHDESWTWTRPDLFPSETKIFIKKMQEIEPNFSVEYQKEELAILKSISQQEAIYYWSKGSANKARGILMEACKRNFSFKFCILYLLTVLSYDYYKRLKDFYFKHID